MNPQDLAELLRDPEVVRQIVELSREPAIVKRLADIATSTTAEAQILDILGNPDIAQQLSALVQRTEVFGRLIEFMNSAMIWIAVPVAISAVTLLLVLYNTVVLRRLLKGKQQG